MAYKRGGIYPLEQILPLILSNEAKANLDGDLVTVTGVRLECFAINGVNCVVCNTKGAFFAKERVRVTEPYHLNLYGYNEHGHEVLMTRDHIIPKSKGGPNVVGNMQTMCTKCNGRKGSTLFSISIDGVFVAVDFEGAVEMSPTNLNILHMLRDKAKEISVLVHKLKEEK